AMGSRRLLLLAVLSVALADCARFQVTQPAPGGLWGKTITVSGALVSGTASLAGFPFLLSITDPELRDLAHGGGVAAGGFSGIDVESYDGATGSLLAWV